MRLLLLVILVSCLLSPGSPTFARTWYITPDGMGDAPTIQAGVDSSSTGDTVLVACGTFTWTSQGTGDDQGLIRETLQLPEALFITTPVKKGDGPNQELPRSQRTPPRNIREQQDRFIDGTARDRLESLRYGHGGLSKGMVRGQGRTLRQIGRV